MPDSHSLSHYNPPVSCKGGRHGYKILIVAKLYVCEIIASDSRGGLRFASQRLLNEPNVSSAKSLQLQRLSVTALLYYKYMFYINISGTFTLIATFNFL